jgi:hypothetical protein
MSNDDVRSALDTLTKELADWISGEAGRNDLADEIERSEHPNDEEISIDVAALEREREFAEHMRSLRWAPVEGQLAGVQVRLRRLPDAFWGDPCAGSHGRHSCGSNSGGTTRARPACWRRSASLPRSRTGTASTPMT